MRTTRQIFALSGRLEFGRGHWGGCIDGMYSDLVTPISERWFLQVNGDIGGFGVESDLTWSATGLIGYDFRMFDTPSSFLFGYRAIGWDYSEGSGNDRVVWDIVQHGLLLGLTIRF